MVCWLNIKEILQVVIEIDPTFVSEALPEINQLTLDTSRFAFRRDPDAASNIPENAPLDQPAFDKLMRYI